MADDVEARLCDAVTANVAPLAGEWDTTTPRAGDLWRAHWQQQAGIVLVLGVVGDQFGEGPSLVQVAPISVGDDPDDSAVHAPAFNHNAGFDLVVWVDDFVVAPVRVLECILGQFTVPGTGDLPRGTKNLGPTDPRTRTRAHVQDFVDTLRDATWVPRSNPKVSLPSLLRGVPLPDVVAAVGSLPVAMQLARGAAALTADQAERLAPLLSLAPAELLSANPPLPDDLVRCLDQPPMRRRVQQLAAQRQVDEVTAWRTAAYGSLALAAREQTRGATPAWTGRVRAYLDAALHSSGTPDGEQT